MVDAVKLDLEPEAGVQQGVGAAGQHLGPVGEGQGGADAAPVQLGSGGEVREMNTLINGVK